MSVRPDGQRITAFSTVRGCAHPDQHAVIVGRLHAVAPLALAVDRPPTRRDGELGADRVAVALGPFQDEPDPVVSGLGVVAQQGRRARPCG